MKISSILDSIDNGTLALPEFQRGYVWNREQVRSLMTSLYRRHPVGSLLVWQTKTATARIRGSEPAPYANIDLLLDGQQRITSLYGIFRGRPPRFFDGNPQAFTGLYFNLREEVFEFYAALKMKNNPAWINVTKLMRKGLSSFITMLNQEPEFSSDIGTVLERLTRVLEIGNIEMHIDKVMGEDKTVDVVVDIFNRVNSGGTKLSKGDLALARICAQWPQAREKMKGILEKWRLKGFDFELEWLLRNVNTVVTGEALFSALKDVGTEEFAEGLDQAEKLVNKVLNLIAGRLGLDHDRVLGSRYSFPVMVRYLSLRKGIMESQQEQNKLLYWYIHTMLWGRYAGSTESVMNQDLHLIEEPDGALDRLVNQLRQNRGDLSLQAQDFMGWSVGARFYPLLYMLTRVCQAKDWGTGIPLNAQHLGSGGVLHLHHIFPKAQLYKHGFGKAEVNALANFCFQTEPTNIAIGDRKPEDYVREIQRKQPGALESQWIPADPELWRIEAYPEFLEARRQLLADAANQFLDDLLSVRLPSGREYDLAELSATPSFAPGSIVSEDEERELKDVIFWLAQHQLPSGKISHPVEDPDSGEVLAVLDLAWPEGLQPGLSQPVALLLDEPRETEEAANRAGYRFFTSAEDLKKYVRQDILAVEEEPAPA